MLLRSLLALALLCALPAAQTPLDRGLDAIRVENIEADVRFLASDELRGRDTPSDELRLAARYLRARLMRLGFQPAGDDGYLHEYALEAKRLDTERSSIVLDKGGVETELKFGRDVFFSPGGVDDFEVSGELVFCGRATAEDVAGIDLAGKWAVAYDSDVPWRARRDAVRARGAVGIVVTPGPDYDDEPYPRRWRSWVWRARAGSMALPGAAADEKPLSYLYVVRQRGAELLGESPALGQSLGATLRETRAVAEGRERFTVENVCGLWPGLDPELSKEVLIVSAHYDHVGAREGEIYNGADDNGSGTTGLLALAEGLAAAGPLRRSVLLIWVSGEEKGLLGSEAWTLNPTLPPGTRAVANVNIDMIGRNAPEKLLVTPTAALEQYNGLVQLAESFAASEGFATLGSCDEYWERSDHKSFSANLGIPVAFLFADVHEDYHQPTDTADKIDCDKIRRVTRLVLRMLDGLQGPELFARVDQAPRERMASDLAAMHAAIGAFADNNRGHFPEELRVIVMPDVNGMTYLGTRGLPLDPWGREYRYEAAGGRVFCLGRDGKPGGEGEDADMEGFEARGR